MTNRLAAAGLVAVVYALHQDVWNWRSPHPLAFGFLPVGLWYHLLYTLAAAGLMALLVRILWPAHLDPSPPRDEAPGHPERRP